MRYLLGLLQEALCGAIDHCWGADNTHRALLRLDRVYIIGHPSS